ncbi:helix-turn-helix domain-containing protein [Shewanella colwelliana]|uniref:helix-turn-helix domain-containing protein n=1 Tax=Shewanella colwelliana TaxID=23 RepID=UPI0004B3F056|nr:helix-turn-helix domain-containing protein [Shewanella colwelliana]
MFRTMNDDAIEGLFKEGMSRLEQDRFMQYLYDKGHNVPAIAKKLGLSKPTVYGRINATRGRGPTFDA